MTESGDLVGTPLYMAPDQISGDAEKIDGRTDIWGLGVTLYELLTGRPPFGGPNAQAILHAILHKDPPLLRKLRDDVPRDLEAVILKCLEKDPARRYTTAANLRDDLLALQRGEAVSAARPRFFDPALRWLRRHPAEGGVLGSVLFVALLLGSYLRATSRQLKTETSAREEAESQKDEALSQQVDYVLQKLEIWARYELLEVRNQFSEAKLDPEREEASERLADVLEQIPFDTCPDVAAEAIELLAAWNQARGVDDAQVLERVEQGAGRDPKLRLMLRAAALAGQGHTDQALLLHRERARLDPADPAPPYDAARLLRRMALAERKADLEARCVALLADALGLLGGAVDLAVAAGDTAALLRILTERARCLIAVEHHDAAHADLDVVLARDPTYFEAFSLRLFCERAQRRREAPPPASSAQPPSTAAVEGLDEEQAPALSIERLLPGREDLTEELQSAGRGLQSIYRGLHDLLRSTVEPADQQAEDDEPDAGDPEQGEPQRGSTGG